MVIKRKRINELPPSMAERAVTARKLSVDNPQLVDVDDDMLPWVYDEGSDLWLSFDGNYSKKSPAEKRLYELESIKKQEERIKEAEKRAVEKFEIDMHWSLIRQAVLERDKNTCQSCGMVATSRLHIHHILKRCKGGTDHLDNLITVCSHCHKNYDSRLYNPNWTASPK